MRIVGIAGTVFFVGSLGWALYIDRQMQRISQQEEEPKKKKKKKRKKSNIETES